MVRPAYLPISVDQQNVISVLRVVLPKVGIRSARHVKKGSMHIPKALEIVLNARLALIQKRDPPFVTHASPVNMRQTLNHKNAHHALLADFRQSQARVFA